MEQIFLKNCISIRLVEKSKNVKNCSKADPWTWGQGAYPEVWDNMRINVIVILTTTTFWNVEDPFDHSGNERMRDKEKFQLPPKMEQVCREEWSCKPGFSNYCMINSSAGIMRLKLLGEIQVQQNINSISKSLMKRVANITDSDGFIMWVSKWAQWTLNPGSGLGSATSALQVGALVSHQRAPPEQSTKGHQRSSEDRVDPPQAF